MEMGTEATSGELALLGRAQGEQGRAPGKLQGTKEVERHRVPQGKHAALVVEPALWGRDLVRRHSLSRVEASLGSPGSHRPRGSGTCSSSNASTANENIQGHGKFSIQSPLLEAGKQEKCKVSRVLCCSPSKIPDLSESQVLRSCYSKTP